MKILIKNVRIVDAFSDYNSDILVKQGKISKIGLLDKEEADEIIDGDGKVLMPGFVDLHVHFRDPGFTYKEDLESGSKAAVRGGYTRVNLMGNTKPIVDNMQVFSDIMDRAEKLNIVNIHQVIAGTFGLEGKEITNFDEFDERVKFISDDGKGIMSNKRMYDLMKLCKKHDKGIMVHAEDMDISPIDYRIAEDLITIRDVYLSGKTDCRVHFCHVSTIGSLEAIEIGKEKGYPVTCEVTPHHISMWDSNYKVNPPIRTKADVDYIISAIKRGVVDCIATDHAPHSKEEKENNAPGMIGLETSFNICYNKLVLENGISLSKLSEIMSYNPSKILGIDSGRIQTGLDADLVLLDLDVDKTIKEDEFVSKSSNSPFINNTYKGEILMTMVSGDIKYRGSNI